jgi:hypothetical protein
LQRSQHRTTTSVIAMPVREHDGRGDAEVDPKPRNILFERAVFRPGIEEEGLGHSGVAQGDLQSMTRLLSECEGCGIRNYS